MTPERVALAVRLSYRWGSFSDRAESISRAIQAVWKAEQTWDPARGCFSSWASYYCRSYLWVLRRSEARRNAVVFCHAEAGELPAPEPAEAPDVDRVRAALGGLPRTQREAVQLVYLDGLTLREAGERLGITHQGVSLRIERALRKMKSTLKAPGAAPLR